MTEQLIGRSSEQRSLDEAVATLREWPCAVVLEGDAGIGKTTLWDHGRRRAAQAGVRVLVARSASSESAYAFAVLGDLLAPVLEETLTDLVPVQRRALEVALALREPGSSPPDARVLGLGLLAVLRVLLRDGPVLLALDDVQWADPASVEVLTFALRRVRDERLGVLVTVRGRPVDSPLGLDRSPVGVTRLPVEPLPPGDLHRLLVARLGLDLPRPALVHVHTTTGGNPFYALELGRGVVERDLVLDDDLVPLPDSLTALMAQRLQVLPPQSHETLVAVAALAAPVVTLVERLGPSAVADVELAARCGLVAFDGDRIRFTHPLLASASYSAMPLHHRRRIHRQLASLPLGPEEVARHLALAATRPDEEIALALDRAAEHAAARGAVQAAAELAERAVGLTPPDDLDAGNRRRVVAADLCRAAGDLPKARAMLQHAVDTSEHGPVRARALSGLASVRSSAEGFRIAENLYLAALDEPGLTTRDRVSVLCDLAWSVDAGGSRGQGTAYAEEALRAAELDGDPGSIGLGLVTVAELEFWRSGRIHRDLLDRAVAIERMTGRDLGARSALARSLGRADRHREACALFEELVAEGRARDDPDVSDLLFFLARAEIGAGDWVAAEQHCAAADEVARQTGEQATESLCRMMRAEIAAYRGDERARQEIAELLPIAADTGFFGAVHRLSRALGCLELSLGRPGDAWRQAATHLDGLGELDEVQAQLAGSVGVEALIGTGDLDGAARLLQLLQARATGADSALPALADRCRGQLLDAHDRSEEAVAVLETAAQAPHPHGTNALESCRTVLALGTAQRHAQHKRDARQTLTRAAEGFDRLGAGAFADRARSELRRIGGRTASDNALSETERLIVDRVVAGMRNREIATDLSLSPHTVAWNLSKVYRKLTVSSRTELVARLTEQPPGKPTVSDG